MENETIIKMQDDLTEKEEELKRLNAALQEKENEQDNIELDPDGYKDGYDDFIDECYPEINIGVTFSPSYVLKNLDPTAYRCGLNDYLDSMEVKDTQEYRDIQEEIDELETQITDLESEIEELTAAIADEEAGQ
jgi:predicted  nucleic acid-binding Zn-ribbon protein